MQIMDFSCHVYHFGEKCKNMYSGIFLGKTQVCPGSAPGHMRGRPTSNPHQWAAFFNQYSYIIYEGCTYLFWDANLIFELWEMVKIIFEIWVCDNYWDVRLTHFYFRDLRKDSFYFWDLRKPLSYFEDLRLINHSIWVLR